MGEVQVTQAWLRSEWHIQVPPAWLDACVNWIKEEANRASIPQAQLNQRVLEQWLLTDLRDLAHPVLPERISEAQIAVLNNRFCVQMDSLLDVSQPAYTQLQRIRGADCSNDEVSAVTQETQRPWEAKPTRMLMLQLTDGVQSLEGMEYRPIPTLNANLPPGTKLQLVGPVAVRLGVLLLKAENVKVLGGEVEQLLEIHSQSRVLCGTLGLPEETHPHREEPDDVVASVADSGFSSLASEASLRLPQSQPLPQISRQDDWDMDEIPDDDFRSIPDHFDNLPQNNNMVKDVPDDFDDIPLDELDNVMCPIDVVSPSTLEDSERNQHDLSLLNGSKPEEVSFHSTSRPGNSHQSRTLNEVPDTSLSSCSMEALQSSTCKETPMYLCSLQAGCWPPKSPQVFRLQAFIVTLVGNLRISGGVWKLGATISDGSGYLDVDLCDNMLSGLIGFSAAETRVLRKDLARRREVDGGIQHCQRELVDMCCMMSVQVDQTGRGVVLSASPISDRECSEMQKRVKEARS